MFCWSPNWWIVYLDQFSCQIDVMGWKISALSSEPRPAVAQEVQQSSVLADGPLTKPKTNKRVSVILFSFHHTNACGRSMGRTVQRHGKTIRSYCFFTRFRHVNTPTACFPPLIPSGTDFKCSAHALSVNMCHDVQKSPAPSSSVFLTAFSFPDTQPSSIISANMIREHFDLSGFYPQASVCLDCTKVLSMCVSVSVAFVTYWGHFWHKCWICRNQLGTTDKPSCGRRLYCGVSWG